MQGNPQSCEGDLILKPFVKSERDALLKASKLFFISFSILLPIGMLSMAFANFELGAILFALGMVLVVGNELISVTCEEKGYAEFSSVAFLPDLFLFAAVTYLLPIVLVLAISHFYGWNDKLYLVGFMGLAATAVKLMAVSVKFFRKK